MEIESSNDEMNYDFAGWRARIGLVQGVAFSRADAAESIGISESHYAKLEREGKGRKLYAWAAYGVECHARSIPRVPTNPATYEAKGEAL